MIVPVRFDADDFITRVLFYANGAGCDQPPLYNEGEDTGGNTVWAYSLALLDAHLADTYLATFGVNASWDPYVNRVSIDCSRFTYTLVARDGRSAQVRLCGFDPDGCGSHCDI